MRRAALLLPLLALAGCGEQSMDRQAKLSPLQPSRLAGGTEAQAPPAGTVAQGDLQRLAAARTPPPVTLALVRRGHDRHRIFCAPCHGETGAGDGAIVRRGFPPPLPYTHPKVRADTAADLYRAITDGYGVMFPQAERVEPADRWAIVAYIRALQLAAASPSSSSRPEPGGEAGPGAPRASVTPGAGISSAVRDDRRRGA